MEQSTEGTMQDQTTKDTPTPRAHGLTKGRVIAMANALGILGNRSMATVNGDLRVGRMLSETTATAERYRKAKSRIALDTIEAQGIDAAALNKLSPLEQMALKAKIDVAQADFEAEPADDFTLPKGVLRQDDLPKEKVGDAGWQNASQLGAIAADLGPLFEFPKE